MKTMHPFDSIRLTVEQFLGSAQKTQEMPCTARPVAALPVGKSEHPIRACSNEVWLSTGKRAFGRPTRHMKGNSNIEC